VLLRFTPRAAEALVSQLVEIQENPKIHTNLNVETIFITKEKWHKPIFSNKKKQ
jgi:hypothetical protein